MRALAKYPFASFERHVSLTGVLHPEAGPIGLPGGLYPDLDAYPYPGDTFVCVDARIEFPDTARILSSSQWEVTPDPFTFHMSCDAFIYKVQQPVSLLLLVMIIIIFSATILYNYCYYNHIFSATSSGSHR